LIELYRDGLDPASHLAIDYDAWLQDSNGLHGNAAHFSSIGTGQIVRPQIHTESTPPSTPTETEERKPRMQKLQSLLSSQLHHRKLWQKFNPRFRYKGPPRYELLDLYEINNGYWAYYLEGMGLPSICFTRLDSPEVREIEAVELSIGIGSNLHINEGGGFAVESAEVNGVGERSSRVHQDEGVKKVEIPADCLNFTFDLSQDLLVTLHNRSQNE
jgi:hypothetical protein